MTKIEAYKAVIAGEINEEVVAKFEELLHTHEVESEKRRNKAAEKRAEKLASEMVLEQGIMDVLGTEPMTASDIKDAVEGIETPQKATVVVKRLVASGLVNVCEVKGKSGKVKGYTLAQYTYMYTKNRSKDLFFIIFIQKFDKKFQVFYIKAVEIVRFWVKICIF